MSTKKTGQQGESAAAKFLQELGYEVLESNYRFGAYEIDLIVKAPQGMLVFIEVKTKHGSHGYDPESSAKSDQMERIARAAGEYMYELDYEGEIRFDVIGVRLTDRDAPLIRHYKDVFFPGA